MSDFIYRKLNSIANGKSVLILLGLTFTLMIGVNMINLPVSVPHIQEVSNGNSIPDMRLYYSPAQLTVMLDKLLPEGRHEYLRLLMFFDFVFPFLYSLSMAALITFIYRKAFPTSAGAQKLYIIPFFAGLFDWLENICMITLLANYPKSGFPAAAAGFFTSGKFLLMLVSLLISAYGFAFALVRRKKLRLSLKS